MFLNVKSFITLVIISYSISGFAQNTQQRLYEAQQCNAYLESYDYPAFNKCLSDLLLNNDIKENEFFYAQLLSNYGNSLILANQYSEAIQTLNRAITLSEKNNYSNLLPSLLGNNAIAHIHLAKYNQAFDLVQNVNLDTIENSNASAQLHLQLIDVYLRLLTDADLNKKQIALAFLTHTDAIINNKALPAAYISQALIRKADLYQFNHQFLDANTLLQTALQTTQQHGLSQLTFKTQWKLAKLFKQMGQSNKSIDYYSMSIQELNNSSLAQTATLNKHLLNNQPVSSIYTEYADVLLQTSHSIDNTETRQVYLQTARQAIENSKAAQLQDFFKDQCVANTRQQFKNLDSVLSADNAVLYPIVFKDRLELLLSTNKQIFQFTQNINKADIQMLSIELRNHLEKRKSRSYQKPAKTLYDLIIEPIEKTLQDLNITTLITIPGQGLHGLPFSALYDGKQFLVEKYALATSPGLELTDPRVLPHAQENILLSGIAEPVQGYPALSYVENELNMINSHYNTNILIDDQFSSAAFSNALLKNNLTIAHIATHGEFGDDVQQSYIIAHDKKISVNELTEYIGFNRFRDTPLELLTLSACYTAAGNETAALGLAGITVKSGARSALATLWPVNDKATAILMGNFYNSLENDKGKAKSLRLAQLELIADIKYRHPGYWSPFILIGNWL